MIHETHKIDTQTGTVVDDVNVSQESARTVGFAARSIMLSPSLLCKGLDSGSVG